MANCQLLTSASSWTSQQLKCELESNGVEVFIVSENDTNNTSGDINTNIHKVVKLVSRKPFRATDNPRSRACLLYQDSEGRLFNVIMTGAEGLSQQWENTESMYAGLEALVAMVLLSRLLCFYTSVTGDSPVTIPFWLSLIIGVPLAEEIGLSMLSVCLYVYGLPSVSAFKFEGFYDLDLPKLLVVGILAISGSFGSVPLPLPMTVYKYLAITGMSLGITVLASNLGSRAWKNMNFSPYPWDNWVSKRFFSFIGVYVMSVVVGVTAPFLGLKKAQLGGVYAIRNIIITSLLLLIAILLTDPSFGIVSFILPPLNEDRILQQKIATLILTAWWMLTTIASLYMGYNYIPKKNFSPDSSSTLLVPNNASPVGHCVLHVPSHQIQTGGSLMQPSDVESWGLLVGAVLAAVAPGIIMAFLGLYPKIQ